MFWRAEAWKNTSSRSFAPINPKFLSVSVLIVPVTVLPLSGELQTPDHEPIAHSPTRIGTLKAKGPAELYKICGPSVSNSSERVGQAHRLSSPHAYYTTTRLTGAERLMCRVMSKSWSIA